MAKLISNISHTHTHTHYIVNMQNLPVQKSKPWIQQTVPTLTGQKIYYIERIWWNDKILEIKKKKIIVGTHSSLITR